MLSSLVYSFFIHFSCSHSGSSFSSYFFNIWIMDMTKSNKYLYTLVPVSPLFIWLFIFCFSFWFVNVWCTSPSSLSIISISSFVSIHLSGLQIEIPTCPFSFRRLYFNVLQKYLASSLLTLIPSSCLHNESDFYNLKIFLIIFIYKL